MAQFRRESQIPTSALNLYQYHCNPGAFGRLNPPWEPCEVQEHDSGIKEGDIRHLKVGPRPFQIPWVAAHREFLEGRQFVDIQEKGPFKSWRHLHLFTEDKDGKALLTDLIDYQFPLNLPLSPFISGKLDSMFRYRHRQTRRDFRLISAYPGPLSEKAGPSLQIGITGSSGFLGQALTSFLQVAGHRVVPLKRGYAGPEEDDVYWWPEPDTEGLEGLDAVVHLAGESVGQLWTKASRERIYFSRAEGTRRLARALAGLKRPPKTFVSASATGYYEQVSDGPVTESAQPGEHFLSEVCQAWEESTQPAADAGIRVCNIRIGLVLSLAGGVLPLQMPAFRLGLGAVLGDGHQMQPFVDRDDVVGAIYHLLQSPNLEGPFNATAPNPVSQAEFAETLAQACSRPLFFKLPEAPFRWLLRDQADLLFKGVEAVPDRLTETGYDFLAPTLEDSLRHQLGLA